MFFTTEQIKATRDNGISGLSGAYSAYSMANASKLLDELSIRLAEVNAVPQTKWDTAWQTLQQLPEPLKGKVGSVPFLGWEYAKAALVKLISKLPIARQYWFAATVGPSAETIKEADATNDIIKVNVAWVKGFISPAEKQKVDTESAEASSWMKSAGSYQSTTDAGIDAALKGGKDDLGKYLKYAAFAAAGLIGLMIVTRR